MSNKLGAIYVCFCMTIIAISIVQIILRKLNEKKKKELIKRLASNSIELPVSEFINLRKNPSRSYTRYSSNKVEDFTGVYIIFNKTKNMYYVGQAKKVIQRVNNHFAGRGNGDVYADFKYGDDFTIRTIALNSSGYTSLDRLEKDTIAAYNAYSEGYNRNRGNN